MSVAYSSGVESSGSVPSFAIRSLVSDALIASRMNPDVLGYWNGAAHLHSFNLPKFLTNALATNDRVITDKNPLIVS